MTKTLLDWALARASEPSTYASAAAAFVALAHLNGAGDAGYFAALAATLMGAVGIVLREKGIA